MKKLFLLLLVGWVARLFFRMKNARHPGADRRRGSSWHPHERVPWV